MPACCPSGSWKLEQIMRARRRKDHDFTDAEATKNGRGTTVLSNKSDAANKDRSMLATQRRCRNTTFVLTIFQKALGPQGESEPHIPPGRFRTQHAVQQDRTGPT